MRTAIAAIALLASACTTQPPAPPLAPTDNIISTTEILPANVTLRPASWYSEQVRVSGRLFEQVIDPAAPGRPAIVLAPGEGATAESLDAYAIALAKRGMTALIVDYRGWGRSGGHIYLGERVDTYDKMRFSEQTPELVIRRGRIDPEHQVQDLRNAITFLQSVDGVDRARIGILGVDLGGGHVISVMGMDTRAKAGVAITPLIFGQGEHEKSFVPDAATQAAMVRLARDGAPPKTEAAARERNDLERRIALAEYKPYWRLDAIPQTAAVRFIVADADDEIDNFTHARAAARELKGKVDVQGIPNALHDLTPEQAARAAELAADWFAQNLAAP